MQSGMFFIHPVANVNLQQASDPSLLLSILQCLLAHPQFLPSSALSPPLHLLLSGLTFIKLCHYGDLCSFSTLDLARSHHHCLAPHCVCYHFLIKNNNEAFWCWLCPTSQFWILFLILVFSFCFTVIVFWLTCGPSFNPFFYQIVN